MLEEVIFYDTLRQALWVSVKISLPILTVALVTGVAIGLLQALTSVQEMTLTFVPKILAVFLCLIMFMPFMMNTLIDFSAELYGRIVSIGENDSGE